MVTWKSKLQTMISLSSTKSDYVSLSQLMREAIPIMSLLDEMMPKNVISKADKTKVKCKALSLPPLP